MRIISRHPQQPGRATHEPVGLLFLILAIAILPACTASRSTKAGMVDIGQELSREECDDYLDENDRRACLSRVESSYKALRRERGIEGR